MGINTKAAKLVNRHFFSDSKKNKEDEPFHFCADSKSKDDWILVQHRKFDQGDTDYFQEAGWEEYKNGFGDPEGTPYWIGLERMHELTSTGSWQLLEVIRASTPEHGFNFVIFNNIKVENEMMGYQLNLGSVGKTYGFFDAEDNN